MITLAVIKYTDQNSDSSTGASAFVNPIFFQRSLLEEKFSGVLSGGRTSNKTYLVRLMKAILRHNSFKNLVFRLFTSSDELLRDAALNEVRTDSLRLSLAGLKDKLSSSRDGKIQPADWPNFENEDLFSSGFASMMHGLMFLNLTALRSSRGEVGLFPWLITGIRENGLTPASKTVGEWILAPRLVGDRDLKRSGEKVGRATRSGGFYGQMELYFPSLLKNDLGLSYEDAYALHDCIYAWPIWLQTMMMHVYNAEKLRMKAVSPYTTKAKSWDPVTRKEFSSLRIRDAYYWNSVIGNAQILGILSSTPISTWQNKSWLEVNKTDYPKKGGPIAGRYWSSDIPLPLEEILFRGAWVYSDAAINAPILGLLSSKDDGSDSTQQILDTCQRLLVGGTATIERKDEYPYSLNFGSKLINLTLNNRS